MINRDEIGKNVQSLLQGYADSDNKVEITTRNPKEADVYIDGKLFNTYLIEEKKFKNNIKSQRTEDRFRITITLSRDDLAQTKSQYLGAELQLPATENEIGDVCLGGVAIDALKNVLNTNKNISKVYLCLDNDEAGDNTVKRIGAELNLTGYRWERIVPQLKDWNEVLTSEKEQNESISMSM